MRTEESAERLTNTPLADDHSGYTVHDYTGQEVEVESASITLGEAQFLAQSREESAACAKATISSPKDKDDSGGCAVDGQGGSGGGGGGGVGRECQRLLVRPTDLSSCEVTGSLTDWRTPMEIAMADSTNDLYHLQVSPLASSSEGWCRFLPTLVFRRSPGASPAVAGWRQGWCSWGFGRKSCLVAKRTSTRWIWVSGATKTARLEKGRAGTGHLQK